ncbi:winged helix-turn-helix domain-containing protein [Microbacterium sp. QXD-8]|uniref:Winged helix-turn-helix domain-containing protein n=1 Tax=Microbacterium psychrotolerans TaxID=3068321 RepID=A0ABU0Z623_9MICO|nr:winged helix-turn-helix domain-containing protein [Microbacterium sp. QXD-8]MDQ7880041.1 winged helix-turn-helix domain-containing protein [Microbacterium sp. QXD-8]
MPTDDRPFPRSARRERITDPERIRALAHPVRIALLDYLGDVAEATATECAEALGESPASCSFHLRMLEKYGYIERAERRGREKPWRVRVADFDMRPDPEVPGSLLAVQAVASLGLESEFLRAMDWFSRIDREPDEWVQATTFTRSSFWATAEELAELSRDVQNLTDRFAGRHTDPSKRPPGARYSRYFAVVNPEPEEQR